MTSVSDSAGNQQTVLVLGGRGFVGSHVVRRLVQAGLRPCLFGPPMEQDLLADLSGTFEERHGDVRDRDAVAAALAWSGARDIVTTVAHSVGRSGLMRSGDAEADNALAVNVGGFRNVLEAALGAGARRVVWTGSTVVYGSADDYPKQPVDEDAPANPLTFYGLTKQMSEDLARYYRNRHAMDVTGLRLPLVLGPGLWYQGAASTIMDLVRAAKAKASRRISFHDDPMDLMHVADVADAVLATLLHPGRTDAVYNINGFTARLSDFAKALEQRLGTLDVVVETIPPALRFPLITDARFRDTFAFRPAYGLGELLDSLIEEDACQDD